MFQKLIFSVFKAKTNISAFVGNENRQKASDYFRNLFKLVMILGFLASIIGFTYYIAVDLCWFYLKHGQIPDNHGSVLIGSTLDWNWLIYPTDYFGVNKIARFYVNFFGWGFLWPIFAILSISQNASKEINKSL